MTLIVNTHFQNLSSIDKFKLKEKNYKKNNFYIFLKFCYFFISFIL